MATESYRDLLVWRKAMDLAVAAHGIARRIPADGRRPLVDQIMRSAVSVPANIAEGSGRVSRRSYLHFLRIARGSLYELDTLLELARRLEYVGDAEFSRSMALVEDVSRLLTRLGQALQRKG